MSVPVVRSVKIIGPKPPEVIPKIEPPVARLAENTLKTSRKRKHEEITTSCEPPSEHKELRKRFWILITSHDPFYNLVVEALVDKNKSRQEKNQAILSNFTNIYPETLQDGLSFINSEMTPFYQNPFTILSETFPLPCGKLALRIFKTKGEGSCVFHALFGKRDYFCYRLENVQEKRQELCKIIKERKKEEKISHLITRILSEHKMDLEPYLADLSSITKGLVDDEISLVGECFKINIIRYQYDNSKKNLLITPLSGGHPETKYVWLHNRHMEKAEIMSISR